MLHFGQVFRGVHLARDFRDSGLDEPDATVLSMLIVEREPGPLCSASELPLLQTPQFALYSTSFGSHDWAQADETQCGVAAWPHEAMDKSTRLVENLEFYPQEIAVFPAFSIAERTFGPVA